MAITFAPRTALDLQGVAPSVRRMTPEQEAHLRSLKERFAAEFEAKYRNGQAEHGGNLYEMPAYALITNLKQEALDLWAYACTLEDQIIEMEARLPHHGA